MTERAQKMLHELKLARRFYEMHGHDVARVTIGIDGQIVKMADDNGAYIYDFGPDLFGQEAAGYPCRVMEYINTMALDRVQATEGGA